MIDWQLNKLYKFYILILDSVIQRVSSLEKYRASVTRADHALLDSALSTMSQALGSDAIDKNQLNMSALPVLV